jgi:putative two-component system response regulator
LHGTERELILIVDDDPGVQRAHARVLQREGFEVELAQDGVEALSKLLLGVDLVVLDGDMPLIDGFEVARTIRSSEEHANLPIIMITGLVGPTEQQRAIDAGVNDFITKPVDPRRMAFRCRWLLEMRRAPQRASPDPDAHMVADKRLATLREALDAMTEARRQTFDAHLDTIRRLTIAAEYKDVDTAGHIERIGLYAEALSRALGFSKSEAERMRHAAPMHDVGKIAIPDSVLLKPAGLDEAEWEVMRSHAALGAQLLSRSPSPLLQLGETIARTHHERWDGTGYPHGVGGEDIPIEGRICAVVDFYDAVTMERPYRKGVPAQEVLQMMEQRSGTHFDPRVLKAFFKIQIDIAHIHQHGRRTAAGPGL